MHEETLELVKKITKDMRLAAKNLSKNEARFLVDAYYQVQDFRIQTAGQLRSMEKSQEPHNFHDFILGNFTTIESQIKYALGKYSESTAVGRWSRSICGIGPVIAAGLECHIDIEKAVTPGHIYSFAGIHPQVSWEKGQKRPWNAQLKTLCWKIGESFVKVSSNDNDFYGKLYLERKAIEAQRNEQMIFEDQAEAKLAKYKIGKDTEAYKFYAQGMLPPGHIHARAKRWAVKLFLSHWWYIAYKAHFKKEPPLPYPIAHLDHVHMIDAPNKEMALP